MLFRGLLVTVFSSGLAQLIATAELQTCLKCPYLNYDSQHLYLKRYTSLSTINIVNRDKVMEGWQKIFPNFFLHGPPHALSPHPWSHALCTEGCSRQLHSGRVGCAEAVLSDQMGEGFPEDQDAPVHAAPACGGLRASSAPPRGLSRQEHWCSCPAGCQGHGCRGLGGRCSPVGSAALWADARCYLLCQVLGTPLPAAHLAALPCKTTLCKDHPSPFQIFQQGF